MAQPINTIRSNPTVSTEPQDLARPISRSGSRSIGTASPALLTPTGTPPAVPATFSSSAPRWNPFSEGRLQQLLSPFEAGTGWRGGEYDADERFAKRAMSHGALASGSNGFGMTTTTQPHQPQTSGQAFRLGNGNGFSEMNARKAPEQAVDDGDADMGMIRRKSMPEGTGQPGSNTLRRPSLSFFSNLSMTRPSSSAIQSHTSSPAPSTPNSPAHAGAGRPHDLKPLSEIPPAKLPQQTERAKPAVAPNMQRSKTLATATVPNPPQEQRHFDPSREPKLHFM